MPAYWTPPKTWNTGEVVTAASLNAHLRDNLDYLRAAVDAPLAHDSRLLTVGYATSSAAFVSIAPELTITLTTGGAPVLIAFASTWRNTIAGAENCLDIAINGVRIGDPAYGVALLNAPVAGYYVPVTWQGVRPLPAGTHTFTPFWRCSGGTLSSLLTMTFSAIELR